jgi:signal transduction histidine kinase
MSLRSRIVLAVTAVFAGISLLTGWLMLIRAEDSLCNAFDRVARTRAEWLLSMVSVDPVILPLPTDTERMRVIYEVYGQKRVLFRSPGYPGISRPELKKRRRWPSYRSVTVQSTSEQLLNGQLSLTLAVPDASLRYDITQLREVFGLGWLLSLVLAFGGGYLVAGWLLKPIQRIVNRANQINDALLIDPIPLPNSRDELYQLTETLNQMLGRIRESAELQRNFFGAAAHELRTPLAVMRTGLEVTLGNSQLNNQIKPFLTGQLDEVSRLTRLLDEFLTLSRPDDSVQVKRHTEIDVINLVKYCMTQLITVAADYEVKTHLETAETMQETVLTDAVKLEHVLLNLLENAIKYARTNSVVLVQVQHREHWIIQIQNQTVRENGPTLDLMQPYFRADPLKEGHGLGLWISYRLTVLLGGTLHLNWQDFLFTSTLQLPAKSFD